LLFAPSEFADYVIFIGPSFPIFGAFIAFDVNLLLLDGGESELRRPAQNMRFPVATKSLVGLAYRNDVPRSTLPATPKR
jgi:hypothetical protein